MATSRSLRLPGGAEATLSVDPLTPGALILAINGITQSHVSAQFPALLFFDYTRRMGNVIDAAAAPRAPLTVLHLGGGGLSLPRYVAATRPGSRQFVVESERGLIEFVLESAPLPAAADVTVVIADALDGLRGLAPTLTGSASVVVCDVYAGLSTPAHLTTAAFYSEIRELVLAPDGIIVVNVADESDLGSVRSQARALSVAVPHVVVVGPDGVLSGREAGNAVIIGSVSPGILERLPDILAAGPHPAASRTLADLDQSSASR